MAIPVQSLPTSLSTTLKTNEEKIKEFLECFEIPIASSPSHLSFIDHKSWQNVFATSYNDFLSSYNEGNLPKVTLSIAAMIHQLYSLAGQMNVPVEKAISEVQEKLMLLPKEEGKKLRGLYYPIFESEVSVISKIADDSNEE